MHTAKMLQHEDPVRLQQLHYGSRSGQLQQAGRTTARNGLQSYAALGNDAGELCLVLCTRVVSSACSCVAYACDGCNTGNETQC